MRIFQSADLSITHVIACYNCKYYKSKCNYCKLHNYDTFYDNHCSEHVALCGPTVIEAKFDYTGYFEPVNIDKTKLL